MIAEEKLEALRKEHGKIHTLSAKVEDDGYEIVVKRPPRVEFKRFLAESGKARANKDMDAASTALEMFLRRHLIHPDKAAFDSMIDERPGLVETFADALLDICGAAANVAAKKA